MTSHRPLVPCTDSDLNAYLSEQARGSIVAALSSAGSMQRIRVTNLPDAVMERLCVDLQGDKRWVVRMLTGRNPSQAWQATATKLIELRNTLEKPLLVFIPHGLRTAAEDSLDIATFSELSLSGLTTSIVKSLVQRIGAAERDAVTDILEYLRHERVIRHADQEIEYLLTILKNGNTRSAIGRALFVFGLLPDAALLDQTNPRRRLSQNQKAAEELADINRPLRERIGRLPIRPATIQDALFTFLRSRHSDASRLWASEIASNRQYLTFDLEHWQFNDAGEQDLRIVLDPLDLPVQSPDQVGDAVQMPVFNLEGKQDLRVSMRSYPRAAEVPAWKTVRIQILSYGEAGEAVCWESNNLPKPGGRNQKFTKTIKVADLKDRLDEGTYYLKVDAYDQDGTLLTQRKPIDPDNSQGRAENESEYFLITVGATEVEAPEPRIAHVASLLDAYATLAAKHISSRSDEEEPDLATVTGSWNQAAQASVRGDTCFELRGEPWNGYGIVLPGVLRKLEFAILDQPRTLSVLRLDLGEVKSLADLEPERRAVDEPAGVPDAAGFLEAREAAFRAIGRQHVQRSAEGQNGSGLAGTVETSDLMAISNLVETYANSFLELVERLFEHGETGVRRACALGELARLDAVELHWPRSLGDPGRALLLGPTHPIRMLWHLRRAKFIRDIVEQARSGGKVPSWPDFFKQIREEILPLNLPLVMFDQKGRAYVDQGCLTNHWSLFLPDRSDNEHAVDVNACRDRVRGLLGLRGRPSLAGQVDGDEIAVRLMTYLTEHPYVEQLQINVFNPGNAQVIADALRTLEQFQARVKVNSATALLRYSVQMFGSGNESVEAMGASLENLLDPDRQVAEDDEFTLSSSNHLLPKLVFARNTTDDYLRRPQAYPAHLTLFLEHFQARARLGRTDALRRGSFVGGLIQEPEITRDGDGDKVGWVKGLRPLVAGSSEEGNQLVRLTAVAQRLHAAGASGQPQDMAIAPVVSLHLDSAAQALIKHSHEFSDWVITIDRNLGVDYYDNAANEELGYLLDYAPEGLQTDRPRMIVTTRSTIELIGFLGPAFEELGMNLKEGDSVTVLNDLRSLSGRLALRLLAAPQRTREILGLLFARWLMGRARLLDDRVIIPLDAHQAWFRERSGDGDPTVASQRADLLLVGFEPAESLIQFTVIEVKLRESLGHAERAGLYRSMREQAERTDESLRRKFDPDLYPGPRADLPLRAKELSALLAFYVKRALRYGLFNSERATAALEFVDNLDAGYRLELRSLGVVFERSALGVHQDEDEPGFVVHRFGYDVAGELAVMACSQAASKRTRRQPRAEPEEAIAQAEDESRVSEQSLESFRTSVGARRSRPADAQVRRPVVTAFEGSPQARDGGGARNSSDEGAVAVSLNGANDLPVRDRSEESAASPPRAERVREPVDVAESNSADLSDESVVPVTDEKESAPAVENREERVQAPDHQSQPLVPDVLLGASETTAQYGLIGRSGQMSVAFDLTGCNTISLFGVQGFGKSYTMGVVAEMATKSINGINVLPSPLATVIFHYHKSDAYPPEFATCVQPNRKPIEVNRLREEFGAVPCGLNDVLLLAPEGKLQLRRQEFPGLDVRPIRFNSGELGAESWKFLLGAYGNESLYVRQLVAIMRRYRGSLTLDDFEREIRQAELSGAARRLAEDRIALARPYIDDSANMSSLLRPGRTIIVDLRDEWVEKDEALGLFVVMLRIFANSRFEGKSFNKLVVFDEAHKYITESDLIGQVVETIREMRHQATSVLIASQDPLSVPRAVVELTSLLILHRMSSPQWLKHLKGAISALDQLTDSNLASLMPGEALVWAQRSTDRRFTQRPQKVLIRPRFTQHGGGTRTAVEGETVR